MKPLKHYSGYPKLFVASVGLLTLTVFSACKKHNPTPVQTLTTENENPTAGTQEGCSMVYTLYAGQHIDVGTITVSNDDENIYVTYSTENGWVMDQTHLYVGASSGIPVNNSGNPTIGLFPYNNEHHGATTFTVTVPIDESLDCYAIAAHASVSLLGPDNSVIQTETAWGNGPQMNESGSWATYSEYCLMDCGCDIETISFDIFGGQTIPAGTLDVTNDDENLYVTYNLSGNWYTGQTHLYVGSPDGLPVNGQNTPIPGQFPYSVHHDPMTQSYTYTIPLSTLPPCYIIAAHSELHLLDANGNEIQEETGWSFGTEFPGSDRWGWYSEYCTQTCP